MDGSVRRTSWIRADETTARGTRMNMNTAIITANRICMTYCRNAMRLPIGISPLETRIAPNHRIATEERLKIAISSGSITANRRFTCRDVAVRSLVRDLEPLLLVPGPHERADDPDAAERLAGDLVDPVDLDLDRLEQRQRRGTSGSRR